MRIANDRPLLCIILRYKGKVTSSKRWIHKNNEKMNILYDIGVLICKNKWQKKISTVCKRYMERFKVQITEEMHSPCYAYSKIILNLCSYKQKTR